MVHSLSTNNNILSLQFSLQATILYLAKAQYSAASGDSSLYRKRLIAERLGSYCCIDVDATRQGFGNGAEFGDL